MARFYAVSKSSDKLYKMSDSKGKGVKEMAEFTQTNDIKINTDALSNKLNEIESMKYILGLNDENQEYSYEFLKSQIDNLCREHSACLVVLNGYLSEIPKQVKQSIDKILDVKDNEELCRKLYEEYLDQYQSNQFFKEYQNYIYTQRSQDALLDLTEDERENFIKIQDSLNRNKRNQLALLFNILGRGAFIPIDFTDNLPQLTMWINSNKKKPIEPLSDDECKIIAVLMGGYYEKILSFNVLSNSIKTYDEVDEAIKNIPVKFGVQNITQVLFRIYLLKPHIWNNREFEELVKSIKSVREAV